MADWLEGVRAEKDGREDETSVGRSANFEGGAGGGRKAEDIRLRRARRVRGGESRRVGRG